MTDNFSGDYNLFGEPVPVRRARRGRPSHVRTQENANKVNLLFATGHEPKECAAALGISLPTFRKHYFFEIEGYEAAALKLRAKLLVHLVAEAANGSVAAIKETDQQIERGLLRKLAREIPHRADQKADKQVKKGKKEIQLDQANAVEGKFAPRQAPSLLN